MAYDARKIPDDVVFALVAAHNQRQEEDVSTFFHADTTSTTDSADYTLPTRSDLQVTSANASDEGTAVTLANEIKDVINTHFADTQAHDTAVSAEEDTADATDTATAVTLANAMKAKYNTHLTEASVHFTNDATNDITSADATNQATLETLLNEFKTDLNAHITSAPTGAMINLVDA